MQILGVPDIVVLERVHVQVKTTVVVHVDVSNEELWDGAIYFTADLGANVRDHAVFYSGLISPPAYPTNFYVFCFKKEFTLL